MSDTKKRAKSKPASRVRDQESRRPNSRPAQTRKTTTPARKPSKSAGVAKAGRPISGKNTTPAATNPAPVEPAVVVQASAHGLPPIRSAVELLSNRNIRCPEEVIAGVLHRGTRGVLAGCSKAGKSWALLGLGMSVATGTSWLNWPTLKGKVLYVNYEIMEATFRERVRRVKAAKIQDCGSLDFSDFYEISLRGLSLTPEQSMRLLTERILDERYSLVILDPLYQAVGPGQERNPVAMAALSQKLQKISQQTDAAFLLAHHYPKGKNVDKSLVDRFAGSMFLTRDADTLIGLTEHQEKNCLTLEFVLRNFPDPDALVLERQPPRFIIREDLDPKCIDGRANEEAVDKGDLLLALLGAKGLLISEWEKQALTEHDIPRATFFREKKKLLNAEKIALDEKTQCWRKCE